MDAREDLALTRALTALPGWEWRVRMGVQESGYFATVREVYVGEWLDTRYTELRLSRWDDDFIPAHPDYVALDFDCATTGGHLLALLAGPVDVTRTLDADGTHRWRVSDGTVQTDPAATLARACANLAFARGYWRAP